MTDFTPPGELSKVAALAPNAITAAELLQVVDEDSYRNAGQIYVKIRERLDWLETNRKEMKAGINKTAKAIENFFREPRKAYEDALVIVDDKRKAHRKAEEKKRLMLEAVAIKAAEKQRKVLEKRSKQTKDPERRDNLEAQAALVQPETVVSTVPDDLPIARSWKLEPSSLISLADQRAFIQWCLEDETPHRIETYLIYNRTALGKLCTDQKDNLSVPGIKSELVETTRRK